MIIVYADSSMKDVRTLKPFSLEFAFGSDENDFELQMPYSAPRLDPFCYVYIDGTELGGMITDVKNDLENKRLVYHGYTWQGLLEHKILEPDSGEDYLTVSGEVNTVLGALINRIELSGLMSVDSASTGLVITNYQFNRYVNAYEGLRSMLNTLGLTLSIICTAGKVLVSSAPIKTMSEKATTETFSQPVNHLICLGKGDLAQRIVVHLYADAKGNVSQTRTFSGVKERTETYDYSNAERDKLIEDGTKRLQKLQVFENAKLAEIANDNYSIDDTITSYDSVTDVSLTVPIEKKIVSIDYRGKLETEYKAGTETIKRGEA